MNIARNKEYVTEYLLHQLMLVEISVVHCSDVLEMTIVACCKLYYSVTVDTQVYASYI